MARVIGIGTQSLLYDLGKSMDGRSGSCPVRGPLQVVCRHERSRMRSTIVNTWLSLAPLPICRLIPLRGQ
jgi:hypothetical protein